MQLSKEYFDKGMSNLMETLTGKIDALETKMTAKSDIQTGELKSYVHQAFEAHQAWTAEHFNELIEAYDVRERVVKLEKDVAQLKMHRTAHA
jgi:hypothetical protein